MVRYYDLVLVLIPLALFGTTGALVAAGFGLTLAAPVGGVLSAVLVGHALFVEAPVDADPRPTAGSGSDSTVETSSTAPMEAAD